MKAPDRIQTGRLILRRPQSEDADAIFTRYAGDPEVTQYLSWPRHTSISQTREFLAFSDSSWKDWPGGPYIIVHRDSHVILGSTGYSFETLTQAMVGYILAKDAWGRGYATEALQAITEISAEIGIRRLYAYCHPEHRASSRVLEKCGYLLEGTLPRHTVFPNLENNEPIDIICFAKMSD